MTSKRDELHKLVDTLAQQRDELRVQMNLAKLEARDEWNDLEQKWEDVQNKLNQVRKVADETGGDVVAAAKLVADEIGRGYERMRKLF